MNDGDAGFAHQLEAARAGGGLVGAGLGVLLENADGGDHETTAGEHADGGHAAARTAGGVALAKRPKAE